MGYEELRAKAAREHEKGQVGAGGALGELPVSLAEHGISTARNNAPCLLPNNLLHALPSGSNGATALALSRDGTRGRASDRAPHTTHARSPTAHPTRLPRYRRARRVRDPLRGPRRRGDLQHRQRPAAAPRPRAPPHHPRTVLVRRRCLTNLRVAGPRPPYRLAHRSPSSPAGRPTARSCSPSRPTARRSCGGRRRWRAPRASRWPPSSTRRLSSAARCSRRRRAAGATRTLRPRAILRPAIRTRSPLTRPAAPLSLPQWPVRAPCPPAALARRLADPLPTPLYRYAVEGLIATGCNDCGLRLWDIATGKLVDQSKKHGARVNACTWNSDGTQVRRPPPHSPPDPTFPRASDPASLPSRHAALLGRRGGRDRAVGCALGLLPPPHPHHREERAARRADQLSGRPSEAGAPPAGADA